MGLGDHSVLTFDMVGTLIDFETGIVDCLQAVAQGAGPIPDRRAVLEAFGRAEHRQHQVAPHRPFTQMLEPVYRDRAAELDLPTSDAGVVALRESIPSWPPFPDSVDTLAWLRQRFRLVALTNADNWALDAMSATLGRLPASVMCSVDETLRLHLQL